MNTNPNLYDYCEQDGYTIIGGNPQDYKTQLFAKPGLIIYVSDEFTGRIAHYVGNWLEIALLDQNFLENPIFECNAFFLEKNKGENQHHQALDMPVWDYLELMLKACQDPENSDYLHPSYCIENGDMRFHWGCGGALQGIYSLRDYLVSLFKLKATVEYLAK